MTINLYAQVFQWGESIKIDITKDKIDTIIKEYVDKNQPQKVKEYQNSLQDIKAKRIDKYSDVAFVNDNLMWEDQQTTASKDLNILESKIYCRQLKLAKKYDWRVPRYDELLTLTDYSKSDSANIDKISYMKSKKYWSISQNINDKNQYWYVDFKDGKSDKAFKDNRNKIRCVRNISEKTSDFEKKINIVIDTKQNIMWQDNSESKEYFETITMAKVYCETLILNGYIDWKMANIKQLQSIIDVTSEKLSIKKPFKYIKADKYWSSTQNISQKDNYWFVDFKNGKVNSDSKNIEHMVRCLRDIK